MRCDCGRELPSFFQRGDRWHCPCGMDWYTYGSGDWTRDDGGVRATDLLQFIERHE